MHSAVNRNWFKLAFINLVIVAILGCLMRYKIAYSFPYLDQKFVQHAHSHFAFAGWITHLLFTLVLYFSQYKLPIEKMSSYKRLIVFNLILAYGMLISFSIQGYGLFSIILSSLSAINSIVFSVKMIADIRRLNTTEISYKWYMAGLLFNVLSTLGTVSLAYMMGSGKPDQNIYLASVYYYLHFQYNGFFFFVCMGICFHYFKNIFVKAEINNRIFRLFLFSCIPAYLLSVLWLDLPIWLLIIVALAALMQMAALFLFAKEIRTNFLKFKASMSGLNYLIFVCVLIALCIKITLQLISTIPALSELAFGFRPIVIAYLHLVLLAIISIFLINFILVSNLAPQNYLSRFGLIVFIAGVFGNEILLTVQGISALSYNAIPFVNDGLFALSLMMLTGATLLSIGTYRANT